MRSQVSVVVLVALGLVVPVLETARAAESSYAAVHVSVSVEPNVTVTSFESDVALGSVQAGDFEGEITFIVNSNSEDVRLSAGVTPLYKGGSPNGGDPTKASGEPVPPIPLNVPAGVRIQPESAAPVDGEDETAAYLEGECDIGGIPGRMAEWIRFESSQANEFNQRVRLFIMWTQDDEAKPAGQYSGIVQLTAMVPLGESKRSGL